MFKMNSEEPEWGLCPCPDDSQEAVRTTTLDDLRVLWELHEGRIKRHVSQFQSGIQGGTAWKQRRKKTVGGSELAILLGKNPYTDKLKLMGRKLNVDNSDPGVACWWGTMLEPVSERLVEIECGTKTYGTDIHMNVPEVIEGHANSPDGFCTIAVRKNENGTTTLMRGLEDPQVAEDPSKVAVIAALLELKAPYRRVPGGSVPKHYEPQVQSGMAISRDAVSIGLFCEVVYRLCSITELDSTDSYCVNYHKGDFTRKVPAKWDGAIGWGMTAVYAPKTVSKQVSSKAVIDLNRIGCTAHGFIPTPKEREEHTADLSAMADDDPSAFDELMGYIDKKVAKVEHSDIEGMEMPWQQQSAETPTQQFMSTARSKTPEGHWFMGYISWKIMRADYHLVKKQEGFIDEIRPLVSSFISDLERLQQYEDPKAAYAQYKKEHEVESAQKKISRMKTKAISSSMMSVLTSVGTHSAFMEDLGNGQTT